MRISKYILISLAIVLVIGLISSCKTHRDCKGRKKTAKTQMGGWL